MRLPLRRRVTHPAHRDPVECRLARLPAIARGHDAHVEPASHEGPRQGGEEGTGDIARNSGDSCG